MCFVMSFCNYFIMMFMNQTQLYKYVIMYMTCVLMACTSITATVHVHVLIGEKLDTSEFVF